MTAGDTGILSAPVELIPRRRRTVEHGISESGPVLLPLREGEQYRFTFDMGACIGCHSCEVACAEQNHLPTDTVWRRVGEIEGGTFPDSSVLHLSMACNHCLEPTCLQGCPTGAYLKLDSGIVEHVADDCIGCQYCTWNCPYSVPVFQPDRKIVTKCDLCKPRLEQGFTSACVDACPTHAIGIETVSVDEWRADHSAADGPNLPSSDITLSTTRLILPDDVPADTGTTGDWALRPEHAHWPLIAVTLLTELALGVSVGRLVTPDRADGLAAPIVAFLSTMIGMSASVLHLGRPAMALKAFRRIRHSWLSREAAAFGLLAAASGLAVVVPSTTTAATAAAAAALAAYVSARLYMVPGRPSWNTQLTVAAFLGSGVATGATVYATIVDARTVRALACIGMALALVAHLGNLVRLRRDTRLEHRGTWQLTFGALRPWLLVRVGAATAAVPCLLIGRAWPALALVVASEVVGRWLFYVTVVPLSMPGSFFRGRIRS